MSTFALPGGRGPACPDLPPTLLPHAIAASAPPSDRMRSLLFAGTVYLALAGSGILLSRARPAVVLPPMRTDPPQPIVNVVLDPLAPAPPIHLPSAGPASASSDLPALPTAPLLPPGTLQDQVPEGIPSGIPRQDLSGFRPPAGPRSVPSGTGEGCGPAVIRSVDVSELHVLRQVTPAYPSMARMAHIQGPVVLQMTIDTQGVPTDVRVVQGHPVFHEEAVRAARQWRFEPAHVDGQAVPATFQLTLNFRLQ